MADMVKTGSIEEIISGGLYCPCCRRNAMLNPMVPTKKPGGLRCGIPNNRWDGTAWTRCGFTIWLETPEEAKEGQFLLRPSKFPVIKEPTTEQRNIRKWFSLAPGAKGGRLAISNAGPGTGKTTTASWSAHALFERLGSLERCYFCAFNRNARTVLLQKLPWEASEIFTLNGLGGRFQGYRGSQYNESKIHDLWIEYMMPIEEEERPGFYAMDELIERMRALCLFNPKANDREWWVQAIQATIDRFGLIDPQTDQEEMKRMMDTYHTWVPILATVSHARKQMIDLSEQWCRAVNEAIVRTGFRMPWECTTRDHEWTDEQVYQFAQFIRRIELVNANPRFLLIDEAQDLSLAQMALYMAAAIKNSQCEVFVIGDDANGQPDDPEYKAGQGIYGWRGSFPGSMKLFARLWKVLTGEDATMLPLTLTHRCVPEVVEAYRPLNRVLRSSRPEGSGFAFKAPMETAFGLWLAMPEDGRTALWITRTNRAAGSRFMATIKARVPCAFRGGQGFEKRIDGLFYHAVEKRRNQDGEYPMDLEPFCQKVDAMIEEKTQGDEEKAADLLETFVVEVAREILNDPETLKLVTGLPHYEPTVGNVRRLLLAYADKDAPRCVSNVYRVKGDEATWVFVSDSDQFNSPWGGDSVEMRACQHVAFSRAKDGLVCVGDFSGLNPKIRHLSAEEDGTDCVPGLKKETAKPRQVKARTAEVKEKKPRKAPSKPTKPRKKKE